MSMRTVKDWLIYFIARIVICMIQALRMETCVRLASGLGYVASDLLRIRARVVDENLKHAFPDMPAVERKQIDRRMWEHLVLMICEIALARRKIHETNWRDYITLLDFREQVATLAQPRPIIMVSAHFGNFELGGFICGLLGYPTYTVARKLDNPFLDRYLNEFRGATGQFMLPKQGSAQQIADILEKGDILTFLGDQYAGPKGCRVECFGRPTSCHKAIALFSLSNRAPMTVTYAKRTGRPLQFEVGLAGVADPLDDAPHVAGVKELTQWYNDRLEEVIRTAPEQYWWLHRRWKDQVGYQPRKSRTLRQDPPQDPQSTDTMMKKRVG